MSVIMQYLKFILELLLTLRVWETVIVDCVHTILEPTESGV
jgi:hypothetical protein